MTDVYQSGREKFQGRVWCKGQVMLMRLVFQAEVQITVWVYANGLDATGSVGSWWMYVPFILDSVHGDF